MTRCRQKVKFACSVIIFGKLLGFGALHFRPLAKRTNFSLPRDLISEPLFGNVPRGLLRRSPMEAPSSVLEPHQVSRITCGFAGSTSGTVARSHSSLDRPRFDLAGVCRLHTPASPKCCESCERSSLGLKNMRSPSVLMHGSCSHAIGRMQSAQTRTSAHTMMIYLMLSLCASSFLWNAHVSTGGSSYSNSAVGVTILCPADLLQRTGYHDAQEPRRSCDLALPQAHLLG